MYVELLSLQRFLHAVIFPYKFYEIMYFWFHTKGSGTSYASKNAKLASNEIVKKVIVNKTFYS